MVRPTGCRGGLRCPFNSFSTDQPLVVSLSVEYLPSFSDPNPRIYACQYISGNTDGVIFEEAISMTFLYGISSNWENFFRSSGRILGLITIDKGLRSNKSGIRRAARQPPSFPGRRKVQLSANQSRDHWAPSWRLQRLDSILERFGPAPPYGLSRSSDIIVSMLSFKNDCR